MSVEQHIEKFIIALNGNNGELDAWLECNNEKDCRIAIFGAIKKESEKMEWQPIETAPEDGRVILFRSQSDRISSAMAICFYRKSIDEWITEAGGVVFFDPTHWMPLPNPPKKSCDGDCVDCSNCG